MANITPTPEWSGVYQLETTDDVLAGPEGLANIQAKQLANRTELLKKKLDASTPTYDTPEAGVDPVTGVQNGAYYNVRSAEDDGFLVEYQNIGGVPTPSGKSYPSSAYVQNLSEQVSNVAEFTPLPFVPGETYGVGRRVALNNGDIVRSLEPDNTRDPNSDMTGWANPELDQTTITNKTALLENLAETVDATPFLQSLINAMPDGMTLDLLGKTFRVKKNTGFASDYPKGDQPCLVVKDKNNVKFTNGKLIVKEHGQGVFDVIRGSASFEPGLILQGAGNFPPLDGTTGRAEKSTPGTGWFDTALYNSGDPRNNSVDTSGYSTGGFGGNFPQWGGGTASTWGVWNGGFIRNYGTGIYCLDSKVDVYGCEIYGFNGGGVDAVGTADVTVERCRIHDNYSTGIFAKAYGDGANKVMPSLTAHNNDIYDIGHPDAKHTDENIDPGYGIATSNSGASTVGLVNFTATNNRVYRCKRKGIEAHHANNWFVHGNHVDDTGFGIYIAINSGHPFETAIITGNKVKNIYYTDTSVSHGIAVFGLASAAPKKGSVVIHGNEVEEVGIPIDPANPSLTAAQGRPIIVGSIDAAIITNNKVRNTRALGGVGISTGVSISQFIDDSVVNGNIVEGYFQTGIFDRNTDVNSSHICSSNVVDLLSTQPFIPGAQTGIYTDLAETSANNIKVPSDFPTNKRLVSSAAPTMGIPSGRAINIRVTFNGTANPSITGSSGTDYIASVTSEANGLSVVLKNINTTVILLGVDFVSSTAPSTGVASLGYMYQRSLFGETGGVLGFKANGTTETHISAASLTSGSIEIKLLTI